MIWKSNLGIHPSAISQRNPTFQEVNKLLMYMRETSYQTFKKKKLQVPDQQCELMSMLDRGSAIENRVPCLMCECFLGKGLKICWNDSYLFMFISFSNPECTSSDPPSWLIAEF